MRSGFIKFTLSALIFLLAAILQLKLIAALGWSFDVLLLASLIPIFFLGTVEFISFVAFSAFILKILYPWSAGEIAAFAVFPLLIFFLKQILPWQSWFEPFLATIFGIFGFYLLIGAPLLANGFGFLVVDFFVSFIFAWGVYAFFGNFTKNER